MSEEIKKLSADEIPEISMKADGMIVRLSKLNRQQILGTDGRKYFIPAIAKREGTKLIFVVGLEDAMPDNEESLKLKKQGMLFAIPVTEDDIKALDSKQSDYISYNIVDTKNKNQLAFMVEVRRMEDLK